MKKLKRYISLLLVTIIVSTMMPMEVLANTTQQVVETISEEITAISVDNSSTENTIQEETVVEENIEEEIVEEETSTEETTQEDVVENIISGSSSYANWTYDVNTATLYINVNGILDGSNIYQLPTYYDETLEEFFEYSDAKHIIIGKDVTQIADYTIVDYYESLETITFEEGSQLTSIGSCVFINTVVTSIELPDTLTTIGSEAFQNCTSLETINLPESLTYIGDFAFSYSSLKSITIPNSITSITDYAFYGCADLEEVNLPSTLQSIGDSAFSYCTSIQSIEIPDSVCAIGTDAFFECVSLESVELPDCDSTLEIGTGIFGNCTSLSSVNFGSAYEIESQMFLNCTNLNEIEIPTTITRIGTNAFNGSGITSITIPASVSKIYGRAFLNCQNLEEVIISDGVTYIGTSAFQGCSGLTEISIPGTVKTVDDYAFDSCTNLKDVTINEGVTYIGYNAFYGCSSILSLTIPSTVTDIDSGALRGLDSLESLYIYGKMKTIPAQTFMDNQNLKTVVLPETLTTIENSAFKNCTNLQSINIPNSVTTIGDHTFANCSKLESVNIPSSLKVIPNYAFQNCTSLKQITIPDGVTTINAYAFYGSGLTSVSLPDSVVNVYDSAFQNCTSLETVELSANMTCIDSYLFAGCSALKKVDLPKGITTIANHAFMQCSADVTIPSTVTEIQTFAFSESGIKNLDLSNNENIILENGCFEYSALESIVIPATATVDSGLFSHTKNLKSVKWPAGLAVPQSAFEYSGLTEFVVESGVYVGVNAFIHSNLQKVTFKAGSLGMAGSFGHCYDLTDIVFEDGIDFTNINSSSFEYCSSLESVVIPEGITNIDMYAFRYCTNLSKIELPASLTTIGASAFRSCPVVYAVIKSDSVSMTYSEIGRYESWNSSNKLDYNTNTVIVGYYDSTAESYAYSHNMVFKYLDGSKEDEDVTAPTVDNLYGTTGNCYWKITDNGEYKSLIIYGEGAIDSDVLTLADGTTATALELVTANSIQKVVFANGITSIPANFMYDGKTSATTVKTLVLPSTLTYIGNYAFYDIGATNAMYFGNSVKYIGDYAFAKTDVKGRIQFSDNIEYIGKYAFVHNTGITSVRFPDSLKTVSKGLFYNCTALTDVYIGLNTQLEYVKSDYSTYPIGFSSGNFKNTNVTIHSYIGALAIDYAEYQGLNYSYLSQPNKYHGYVGSSTGTGKWAYYPETKTLYIDSLGYYNLNGYYYSDGTPVQPDDMDVETLIICYGITKINNTTLKESPFAVFNPEKLVVSASVNEINAYAFKRLTNLKNLTINSAIKGFNASALSDCTKLEGVTFAGESDYTVNAFMFKNFKFLKFVDFGSSLTSIYQYSFQNATALEQIIIPDSVTNVSVEAFYKCISVQNIEIGSGVLSIGHRAFANLPYCEYVLVKGDKFATATGTGTERYVFDNIGSLTAGVTVEFADGVNITNLEAFGDENITTIILGKDVAQIQNLSSLPYVSEIIIDQENPNFYTLDGCIYNSDNQLVYVPAQAESVTIADGTTAILDGALKNCNIRTITIPDSVTSIGASAFQNCTSLKKVNMGNGVVSIGDSAFRNCSSLKIIDLPTSVTSIGNYAFADCSALASVIMGDNVATIGDYAFQNCTSLIGIVISEFNTYIGSGAFENCISMEDICIWMDTALGENVFTNCTELTIHTIAASDAYVYAREHDITYSAYTDADIFYDVCAMKLDVYAGYIGFCTDGHGDIQYLTVYEADCINDGYIIGVCEYCSEIIEEKHIDASGHDYEVTVHIDATDTTAGMTIYTCNNCNDQYAEYSDATGDNVQITTQTVSGFVAVADDSTAQSGTSPAKNVSIVIDGITVATTDEYGCFSTQLESGVYQATLRYSFGFDRVIYITVGNSDVDCGTIAIIGCDWNRDGVIDTTDNNLLKMVMSSQVDDPSYMEYADMNNDGVINVKDWVIAKNCSGIDSSTYNYQTVIIE